MRLSILPLCLLPVMALPLHAQTPEVMRAGKRPAPAAQPNTAAAQDAPNCKQLNSGAVFCEEVEDGVKRWVLQGKPRTQFAVGDSFPIYKHSMLMDLRRYKLPAVTGPWRYYVVAGMIYRVAAEAPYKVLEVIGPTYGR